MIFFIIYKIFLSVNYSEKYFILITNSEIIWYLCDRRVKFIFYHYFHIYNFYWRAFLFLLKRYTNMLTYIKNIY